jgi:hypothetical protein
LPASIASFDESLFCRFLHSDARIKDIAALTGSDFFMESAMLVSMLYAAMFWLFLRCISAKSKSGFFVAMRNSWWNYSNILGVGAKKHIQTKSLINHMAAYAMPALAGIVIIQAQTILFPIPHLTAVSLHPL